MVEKMYERLMLLGVSGQWCCIITCTCYQVSDAVSLLVLDRKQLFVKPFHFDVQCIYIVR